MKRWPVQLTPTLCLNVNWHDIIDYLLLIILSSAITTTFTDRMFTADKVDSNEFRNGIASVVVLGFSA